jgi:hypothetical protein
MNDMTWALLVHLANRRWIDDTGHPVPTQYLDDTRTLLLDRPVWDALLPVYAENGVNTLVIDLGRAVRYDSHPEIALDDAWSTDELRTELAKIRSLGLTPIPKLNFSACHDEWLAEYARMKSTETYYRVCADLIAEVSDLFDTPPLFHLGMDEETWNHQQHYSYAVIRQHELWWHDLLFFVDQVEKTGSRGWIWSDAIWHHEAEFLSRMPKSVMQSNWYYGGDFKPENDHVRAYHVLEDAGFDQIPTGSNWASVVNFGMTVDYCRENMAPERLKGFLQTVWRPAVDRRKEDCISGAREVGFGRRAFEKGR